MILRHMKSCEAELQLQAEDVEVVVGPTQHVASMQQLATAV